MALNLAKQSNLDMKHSCIFFKNNQIITMSCNDHVIKRGILSNDYGIHAEAKAFLKLRKSIKNNRELYKKLRNCHVLVIRIGKTGELRESKPCYHCTILLRSLPIKNIYYSTQEGSIEMVRRKNIENTFQTLGWRTFTSKK